VKKFNNFNNFNENKLQCMNKLYSTIFLANYQIVLMIKVTLKMNNIDIIVLYQILIILYKILHRKDVCRTFESYISSCAQREKPTCAVCMVLKMCAN